MSQRTLILLKPDTVKRKLLGRIISRFEEKGLCVVGMKLLTMTQEIADRHYAEHKGKPFFPSLCAFMTSAPLVAMVLEGPDAIRLVRLVVGATKVEEALPGTIRGDFGLSTQENLVHASDSPASAEREVPIWFTAAELTS